MVELPGLGTRGFAYFPFVDVFMDCFLDERDGQWKIHSRTLVFLEHKGTKYTHFVGKEASQNMKYSFTSRVSPKCFLCSGYWGCNSGHERQN